MDPFTLGALALGALLLGGRRNAARSNSAASAPAPNAQPIPPRRRTRRGSRGRGANTANAAPQSAQSAEQLENKRKNHAHELAAFLASGAATADLIKRYQIFLGVPPTGVADAATLATLERYGAAQVSGLELDGDDESEEA